MSKALSAWAAGMARRKAAKMTKRQRSEHARKMALARWTKQAVGDLVQNEQVKKTMDVIAARSASQVDGFRELAKQNGWELTPEIESRMLKIGWLAKRPVAQMTTEQGILFLVKLYRQAKARGAK